MALTFISTQTVAQSGPSVPLTSAAAGSRDTEALGSLTSPIPVLDRNARTLAVIHQSSARTPPGSAQAW